MTARKDLKRLIRARMLQTGESYTAARQFFLDTEENPNMSELKFQTIANNVYGFRLEMPAGWKEVEPDLNRGPFEIARFIKDERDVLQGGAGVFRVLSGVPESVSAANQSDLEAKGFGNFARTTVTLNGSEVIRLDFYKKVDKRRHPGSLVEHHHVRHYYFAVDSTVMVVAMHSPEPERDAGMLDHIAASFTAMEDGIGVLFVHDAVTPTDFVTSLLEETFGYSHLRAMRALLSMDVHGELVVARVEKGRAQRIVDDIIALARSEGLPFECRLAVER